ncbi:MAG: 2-succinylbenzoate-CoA ligase [Thermomicrobiales bacterium]|nr:2-succinylbenzoate-CoA ligase [Thermomicrobiales bacterium]
MTDRAPLELPNWLDIASRNHPDKLALEFAAERWTYSELRQRVEATAATLARSMSEQPGRIGILSANRPGFVVAVHAATRLGIPFVPLNWRLSDAELTWQLQDAGITLVIADDARPTIAETARADQGIMVIPIAALEHQPPARAPSPIAMGEGLGVRVNSEAAVLYTSGTSGRPKGAILTYGNLWSSAIASALHLGHHTDDIWLATMPLFHIGGLSILMRSAIGAVPVILHDRFDPHWALDAIDSGVTLVSLVPTMLERMLDIRGQHPWPAHFRCILLGGSAAPPALLETCRRLNIPIAPTYGLTEAASQVTTLLPDRVSDRPGSSGLPLPLTQLRIASVEGEAPPGEIGEIEIRGPTLFNGYLGDPRPRTPDDWFATGDVGYLDDDGYLYVVDRRDDLIVSGGENIYPAEIERVLRAHPLVSDAGVCGVPHESWGARPVAAVIWHGDPAVAETELRRFCARELPSYKLPDRFALVTELPRTPSGKLIRRTLAEYITPTPVPPPPKKAPLSRGTRERGFGG